MVERIDKTDRLEYWKVGASTESQKDREQKEESPQKDAFASLSEKTDWRLLFDKSKLWKRNIQILKEEIKSVVYRKINLKTDPSLLRVDIELNGGEWISPAFLAVSRQVGLKIKNLKSREKIPPDLILNNNILRITVPANPQMFRDEEEKRGDTGEITVITKDEKKKNPFPSIKIPFSFETALILAVVLVTFILLIGGLSLIR